MRNDQDLALRLRKAGKSYKQIEKELSIPRSTLVGWFSHMAWSQKLKLDLTKKANYANHNKFRAYVKQRQAMWEAWREEAREQARREFPNLVKDPLFLAGIMLYWGEGDSKLQNGQVRLSNIHPDLIRIFTKFLVSTCGFPLEKLKAQMILYPDLDARVCQKFWSQASGIPPAQFMKTQIIKGRHPTKRLTNGVFQVNCRSRQLKEKIAIWIDLFQKQFPH